MQKFVQDLTWHLNVLKVKDLPEIVLQQAEVAARKERAQETTIDVYPFCRTRYCAHPWEIDVTLVAETNVPDACLKIPAVSCVVNSANAGKLRSISFK